jgi:thioredoxin-related protein
MRAALEYVVDEHYKTRSFGEYLEQADPPPLFADETLNPDPLFSPPPYALDRSRFAARKPLLVIFEQPRCHACDVLHSEPLQNPLVRKRLRDFEVVQLNVWDDATPVLTPDGKRMRARQWARHLGLFYAPTLIMFDERGKEVFRVDSVVQFSRLANVLRYVADKAYLKYPLFQLWSRDHANEEASLLRTTKVPK